MNAPRITWIGHATLLVEMNGVRILTDPVIRDRVGFIGRRSADVDLKLVDGVDAVLLSHMHHDHLDLPSLRYLGRDTRLIVPTGAGASLARQGFSIIEELSAGDYTAIESVSIGATHAEHDGFRAPFGPTGHCLGYMMHGEKSVYFAGDTDIFPEMVDLAGKVDVALLPIWGWGPSLGEGHLDPERAAESLGLVQPRVAVPIHWGTFAPLWLNWSTPRYLSDPPHAFADFASEIAPDVDIQLIRPGQNIHLAN